MPQQKLHVGGKAVGDIKSGGGYVLGPMSPHPSGATYTIARKAEIATLDGDWAATNLTQHNRPQVDVSLTGAKIPRGSHDNEMHRMAGLLRHQGFGQEAIEYILTSETDRFEDRGDDFADMIKKHAREICKKPVGSQLTSFVGSSTEVKLEDWNDCFVTLDKLEDGDVKMLVPGFLSEGTSIICGLPGQCKTFFALSLAKALTTGQHFLGKWAVPEPIPVLYLIPESSGRAFKARCRAFGITCDPKLFRCRTVSQGRTIMLNDPLLVEAVKELVNPVIFLDTLPRFNEAGDENDAAANKKLVDDITALRSLGASVICVHHSTKASATVSPTLQNALRGTGDFGAMIDCAYHLRRDEALYNYGAGSLEFEVRCLKAREFDEPPAFKIAAKYKNAEGKLISFINESGDFQFVESFVAVVDEESKFLKIIYSEEGKKDSTETVAKKLGVTAKKASSIAKRAGYKRDKAPNGEWHLIKESRTPPSDDDREDQLSF